MKKMSNRKNAQPVADEILPEHRFDYRKSRPNRFASKYTPGGLVVVVEPDISKVFPSAQAVNNALRALINALKMRS